MKKKNILLIIFLVIAIAAVIAGILVYNNSDTVKLQRQLDLGQRYLSELNYEEAVVAFNQAIEIDPRNADAYLGLADAYIGLGDEEAALAVLERGYESTGDERLKARMDEIEAASVESEEMAVENEITVPEPVLDSGEVAKRLDEIDKILDGDGRPHHISSNGSTRLLTYDQIESAYRPLAEELEMFLEYGNVDENGIVWSNLADIYLYLGEMDKCLEVRRRGFEVTGLEILRPEEYESEEGFTCDEYGRVTGYSDRGETFIYGEGDRCTVWDFSSENGEAVHIQFDYDSLGRIESVLHDQGKFISEYSYEYQGDYSVIIIWKNTNREAGVSSKSSCTLIYDEYGDYGTHQEWIEIE